MEKRNARPTRTGYVQRGNKKKKKNRIMKNERVIKDNMIKKWETQRKTDETEMHFRDVRLSKLNESVCTVYAA